MCHLLLPTAYISLTTGKKGASLNKCLADKSDFVKVKCPEAALAADAQTAVQSATATCYQSLNMTCNIFRNASGSIHFEVSCKAPPQSSDARQRRPTGAALMVSGTS
jgi:hypothetical protein